MGCCRHPWLISHTQDSGWGCATVLLDSSKWALQSKSNEARCRNGRLRCVVVVQLNDVEKAHIFHLICQVHHQTNWLHSLLEWSVITTTPSAMWKSKSATFRHLWFLLHVTLVVLCNLSPAAGTVTYTIQFTFHWPKNWYEYTSKKLGGPDNQAQNCILAQNIPVFWSISRHLTIPPHECSKVDKQFWTGQN